MIRPFRGRVTVPCKTAGTPPSIPRPIDIQVVFRNRTHAFAARADQRTPTSAASKSPRLLQSSDSSVMQPAVFNRDRRASRA